MLAWVVLLLCAFQAFAQDEDSTPTLANPLAPAPTATAKQPFSWTLPIDTFTPSDLTYAALNLPSFLTFSPSDASLTGTPAVSDVGTYSVRIAASKDGETASDTLAVTVVAPNPSSRANNITTHLPIADQMLTNSSIITSAYPFPRSSEMYPGVRVPPGWSFSLGFQPSTFTASSHVYYSALLADGSPLPPWLLFNDRTVTFDGVAPAPNVSTVYQILLSGSTTPGGSDITQGFNISISAHGLEQMRPMSVNLTAGYPIHGSVGNVVLNSFAMDGKKLNFTDVNITLQIPSDNSWAKFDPINLTLSGTPPAELANHTTNFTVGVSNKFGDSTNSTFGINFYPSIFTSDKLGPVLARPGDLFQLSLSQFFSNHTLDFNLTTAFDPPDAEIWLEMDPLLRELTGQVPSDITMTTLDIFLKAQDFATKAYSHAHLIIAFSEEAAAGKKGLTKPAIVGIAIAVLMNVVLVIAFIGCCIHRRRHSKRGENTETAQGYIHNDKEKDGGYDYTTPKEEYTATMEPPSAIPFLNVRDRNGDSEKTGGEQRSKTMPATVVMAMQQQHGQQGTPDSTGSTRGKRFLANPFTSLGSKKNGRPKISNPILLPSFSNAAFQAQLAIAVDQAGIVSRGGGTYNSTGGDASVSASGGEGDYTTDWTDRNGASTDFVSGGDSYTGYDTNTHSEGDAGYTTTQTNGTMGTGTGMGTGSGSGSEYTAHPPSSSEWTASRQPSSSLGGGTDVEISRDAGIHAHKSDMEIGVGHIPVSSGTEEGTMSITDDISYVRSSRASWESEPPFVWHQGGEKRGSGESGNTGETHASRSRENSSEARHAFESDMGHTTESVDTNDSALTGETVSAITGYSNYTGYTFATTGLESSVAAVEDIPVQRADFRRPPQPSGGVPMSNGSSTGSQIQHNNVTPTFIEDDPGFSIDNIHFPTDSDLAATEGGGSEHPSENEPVVITTASRYPARKTLDQNTSSPASDHTARAVSPVIGIGGVGPIGEVRKVQSRLVSFGKPKVVEPTGFRSSSQTAVISNNGHPTPITSDYGSPSSFRSGNTASSGSSNGTGETTPLANPARRISSPESTTRLSRGINSEKRITTQGRQRSNTNASSQHSLASILKRPRHTHTRTPTPPGSLPSLPALPTLHSMKSVASSSISTNSESNKMGLTRVLLGVNEAFHFYPPLNLGNNIQNLPGSTSATTDISTRPDVPGDKNYLALLERKEGGGTRLEKLPRWLHFEEMELWGSPERGDEGVWEVRIVERGVGGEKIVGRFALEVVGR